MKIRRFLELFDTEEMKAKHEIDHLRGNLMGIGKEIDYNFKDESIGKFIQKISSYHYHFLLAFEQSVKEESGELEIDGFKVYVSHDEGTDYWALVTSSERYTVGFGIKINRVNNYDIFIYMDDESNLEDDDKNPGVEYDELTYAEILPIIKEIYIPFITEAGFGKLLEYKEDYKTINN